jgi:hypothetical protein
MKLRRRRGPHAALRIAVTLLPAALSSCTLVGAGVGAGIDSLTPGPYEERPPADRVRLERRERIIVRLRSGARVSGRYVGVHGPTPSDPESYLLVDTEQRVESVRASDVCILSVEVPGKGWLYGGLIGVAIDATLVVATVVALQNMDFSGGWSNGSDGGCFC